MAIDPTENLKAAGIVLPNPAVPVANYLPVVVTLPFLAVSGQLPLVDGALPDAAKGRLSGSYDVDAVRSATERCVVNILAIVQRWCAGDWSRVVRCVRLGGFFQVEQDFFDLPKVMNGASDLMVRALGDDGKHVRTTVGVLTLPMNAVAEVDALFEVKG